MIICSSSMDCPIQ